MKRHLTACLAFLFLSSSCNRVNPIEQAFASISVPFTPQSQSLLNGLGLVGSAYIAATSGCTPTRTNTALGAFLDTDCPGATVDTNPGLGAIQTTDFDTIKFAVNGLPAGTYAATMVFSAYVSTGAAVCSFGINDGSATKGTMGFDCPLNVGVPVSITGIFSYSSAGNRTFELYGASSSNALNIYNQTLSPPLNSWFYLYRIK